MLNCENRTYKLPKRTSEKFIKLTKERYFEDIKTDIENNTYFTEIQTDKLKTSLWVMIEDFREDCKSAVKIIDNYYKKYVTDIIR